MATITIGNVTQHLSGSIVLPASKSISNRLLILDHLFPGKLTLSNLSEADDTLLLQNLLTRIRSSKTDSPDPVTLDCANAGTVVRFLAALLAQQPGEWILKGEPRMQQRPIGALVSALKSLGADIRYLGQEGYPPLLFHGTSLMGQQLDIEADISSQFITSLLLLAPTLPSGLTLNLVGEKVSMPYIEMTLQLLQRVGIEVHQDQEKLSVQPGILKPTEIMVEPDWSSAAFLYEVAALSPGANILLKGLSYESLQGDRVLLDIFELLGVQSVRSDSGISLVKSTQRAESLQFNFKDHPDIAPAVITTALILGLKGEFTGLKSLKIKESDRLNALLLGYQKMGAKMESDGEDRISFLPQRLSKDNQVRVEVFNDHRMAMTYAPLALYFTSVSVDDPHVVSKSYPDYWNDMASLGFVINY